MISKSNLKALKEGDVVEHTIRMYQKDIAGNYLPTAYCNEMLPDGTMDKRPILPINSDDVVLFEDHVAKYENGKLINPYHYGQKIRMRIVDASNDNYYLAYYYVSEVSKRDLIHSVKIQDVVSVIDRAHNKCMQDIGNAIITFKNETKQILLNYGISDIGN